ncbi:hypothetical protein L873DRAFT_1801107 [Choiromyces venosus 120613-1]|uniref:Hemerythrin-like domain-containing protein n=1 Tax=Choiromyces venosus 120613-1 TaxID=1336337 RepID=A0A3N4JXJ7_9PEZI|nr:hypothetical protein L873DRAFT_1801107 [Choiromyces venosus 120613-1]
MTLIHNVIIRGMNSIYLQAPHVPVQDVHPFIGYCKAWSEFLHAHHDGEEAISFPSIEKAVGVPGLMQLNISQHQQFHDGVTAFDKYIAAVTPEAFAGQKLNEIIDTFARPLTQHLTDEIPTLVSLREYGIEKVPITKIVDTEIKHQMGTVNKTTALAFLMTALDVTYEGGLHKNFPPAPAPVLWFFRNACTLPCKAFWKFAPCTTGGKPRELYLGDRVQ